MRRLVFFLVLLTFSIGFTVCSFAQEKRDGEEIYTIKQGDTLWDISAKFLKDPFLWPKLWQRNPYITNPHWIYPGQPVRIVPEKRLIEEVPKEELREPEIKKAEPAPIEPKPPVAEVKPEEKAEEKVEAVRPERRPEERAAEVRRPVEEKLIEERPSVFPEITRVGFVGDINFRGIGLIVDNRDGKNLLSEGDIVYMAFRTADPVMVGNKYTIFRPVHTVRDPATKRKIGMRYVITGHVQVIDHQGNFYAGRIIEAFDAIQKGDRLRPYLYPKDR